MIAFLLQVIGVSLLVTGGFFIYPPLALLVAGFFVLTLGWAMDGVTNDGLSTAD